MIQRIQSVYFLLSSIATLCLVWCPTIILSQKADGTTAYTLTALGLMNGAGEMQNTPWGYLFLTIAGILLPLAAMMTYKNRKRQMQLANYGLALLVLICITMVTYGYSYSCGLDTQMGIGAGLACPVVAAILLRMGYKGVKKDEDLIRSAERFRA